MKNLSNILHQNGQRFVLILDPAIPSEAGPDYHPVRDQKAIGKRSFVIMIKFWHRSLFKLLLALRRAFLFLMKMVIQPKEKVASNSS